MHEVTPGTSIIEIERNFLVDALPLEAEGARTAAVRQGYLTEPGADREIRVRAVDADHSLAIKEGSGRIRTETEIVLTEDQFEALWPLTAGARISKVRHYLPAAPGLTELIIDEYTGSLAGLIIAEAEFTSSAAADGFQPASWMGREVTEDERYTNRQLAYRGRPARR